MSWWEGGENLAHLYCHHINDIQYGDIMYIRFDDIAKETFCSQGH
jgi:hypothetical protein